MTTSVIFLPAALIFMISAIILLVFARNRRRLVTRKSIFVVSSRSIPNLPYLQPPKASAPSDTLCAICLGPISAEAYGQTSCCNNYLHSRCVVQYQTSGAISSGHCCLCQRDNRVVVHAATAPTYVVYDATPFY